MKRLVALVVFVLSLGIAAPAGAAPMAGDWVCVAIYPLNLGVCVGNPFP